MKILVTGGAGYIGSHVVKLLGETSHHNIVVVDNLSTGNRSSVLYGSFVQADLADAAVLDELFGNHQFDAVIHFAASIVVPESVEKPIAYYQNNTVNTIALIDRSIRAGVKNFIFSSTAAVYGEPEQQLVPVDESCPTIPINPYGRSKLMSEWALADAARANPGFRFVILRYFNVAGASLDGRIGQSFPNATHLIKVAAQTALGKRDKISIFGTDYPTADGTCVRDYIHIEDLADAHVRALDYLDGGGSSETLNCGYGRGYSVKQVLDTMQNISGNTFQIQLAPRRPGDPAALVADSRRLIAITGWQPRNNDLELICKSALEWERRGEN